MKKKGFLFLILPFLLSACEIIDGNDNNGMKQFVQTYTVESRDWKRVGNAGALGSYYFYTFEEPNLTENVYEYGKTTGYIFWNENQKETQKPLPFTDYLWQGTVNSTHLYEETYSYYFAPGRITFTFHCNDFETTDRPPRCIFKVAMNFYP